MGVAAVVVTYYPDDSAINNIKEISKQVDFLCVVDNTSTGITPELLSYASGQERVQLFENKNRGGIAGALNQGCDYVSKKKDFEYILMLDQDSCLPTGFVESQVKFLKANNTNVVVPLYFDINSKSYGNYVRLERFWFHTIFGGEVSEPFYTTFAITSGTMMRTEVYAVVGRFNESYFIDHVDSEYCLRIKQAGLRVLVNNAVCFAHEIGRRKMKKLFGIAFKPNFHSPQRRYYTARNAVFLIREWGRRYPALIALLLIMNLYQFIGVVLYEDLKKKKIHSGLRGLLDGIRNKSGEVVVN